MVISDLVPGAMRGTSPVDPNHVGSLMQSWVGWGAHPEGIPGERPRRPPPEVVGKAGQGRGETSGWDQITQDLPDQTEERRFGQQEMGTH